MSQVGEVLFRRLREKVPQRTINQFANTTPIVPAALAANAGIVGAASIVLRDNVARVPDLRSKLKE
jgi:predicted NBD/HSP70 family sugar kinase